MKKGPSNKKCIKRTPGKDCNRLVWNQYFQKGKSKMNKWKSICIDTIGPPSQSARDE